MSAMHRLRAFAPLLLLTAAAACATTPFGRRQLELFPEAQLESQASQLYDQMRAEKPVSKDERKKNLVLCVANAVTSVLPAGSPQRWEVTLFEDDTANAFALPGAKIGVHTGLLDVAENQHQLAAVLGHEVAHVLERHSNARASGQTAAQLVLGVGSAAVSPELAGVLGLGAQFGVLMPFSRSHESIADKFGVDIMADAGFDPRESVELWRNMASANQGAPPEWASTHPSHATRIADLSRRMPKAVERSRRAQEAGRRPQCD